MRGKIKNADVNVKKYRFYKFCFVLIEMESIGYVEVN